MNTQSEFFIKSKRVAEDFLQTAVVIDDRLFESGPGIFPKKLPGIIGRKPAVDKKTTVAKKKQKPDETDFDPHAIVPQDLINSFAKKRIVCSVYQPKRSNFSTGSGGEFRKLCRNADIVIIDWSLFKDDGQHALDLISGIVEESLEETLEQLRLIIAYTGASNLFAIADKIFVQLSAIADVTPEPEKEDSLAIRFGPSRVIVLGKKNGRTRLEKYQKNEVSEIELADRAVEEFALMTAGLMSNIALRFLAALRSNTRKIISRFSPDLDVAFLNHRILSLPDENAESHLLDLISSEIHAVIEDCFASDFLTETDVKQWLDAKISDYSKINKIFKNFSSSAEAQKDFLQLCLKGAGIFKDQKKHPFKNLTQSRDGINHRAKLTQALSGTNDYIGNFMLAHNMAFRTFYTMAPRVLTMGTLLCKNFKDGNNSDITEYWLVIQPRCDSVRLEEETRFPMLRCRIVPPDDKNSKRTYIVMDEDRPTSLLINFKPNEIRSTNFKPDSTKQVVSKHDEESDAFFFESCDGQVFRWVGELKFEHAQRVVQKVADELSRVGLTESEWLRLYGS